MQGSRRVGRGQRGRHRDEGMVETLKKPKRPVDSIAFAHFRRGRRVLSQAASLALCALCLLLDFSTARHERAWAQAGGSYTFPETGKTVSGRFLQYWTSHGGLPQQGYPVSEEMQETSDINGKSYVVQYFERAVFELHP
ncbi:MAG: thermitase, partial [Chloroflexia bacterium]|nr:thermitase [Chloroflexia bacterium]